MLNSENQASCCRQCGSPLTEKGNCARSVAALAAPAADSRDTEAAQALTADDLRVGLESLLRDLDFHSQYWKWLPSCTTSAYYAKLIRATLAASVPEDHK